VAMSLIFFIYFNINQLGHLKRQWNANDDKPINFELIENRHFKQFVSRFVLIVIFTKETIFPTLYDTNGNVWFYFLWLCNYYKKIVLMHAVCFISEQNNKTNNNNNTEILGKKQEKNEQNKRNNICIVNKK
jgi:hypothetical protein